MTTPMPSDSNTPVTQAHLPATQAEECDAAGYTKSMRELLDSLGGYQNVFNAIADATSVYAEGVGVNIGVRAFIRSITPHSQSHSLPGDVGTALTGLEWSEDGYSLRTPFDGDVDGDGRHVVVGGETVITFADSDVGEEYRERILAALTPSPCPGDVGTDAEAWLRAISDWLLANDHDMTLPSGVLDTDPLDIADRLASLSTPTAEPMGERVCSACDGESKGCTGEYRCLRCEGTGVEPDFVDGLDNRPKADDAAVARAARAALGDWLAWPDAARDGAVPVDNEQTISWLQGLPAKLTTPPTPDCIGKHEDFAPCPTCKQYSHSIGDDALAKAFMHFEAMTAHPVRGHPMGYVYDETTRDAAQVLIAAAKGCIGKDAVREALGEAFDFLGGCDGASEIRGKILRALSATPSALSGDAELERDLNLARLGDYPGAAGVKRMAAHIDALSGDAGEVERLRGVLEKIAEGVSMPALTAAEGLAGGEY